MANKTNAPIACRDAENVRKSLGKIMLIPLFFASYRPQCRWLIIRNMLPNAAAAVKAIFSSL